MKIYVDAWFTQVIDQPYTEFKSIWDIPQDCDIIGISFYNSDYNEHFKVIRKLKPQCRNLVVNISEPTITNISLRQFLKSLNEPNIHFFGDAALNFDCSNWKTMISWFIQSENFYANQPWAKELISRLTPWQNRKAKYKFDALLGRKTQHRDWVNEIINSSSNKEQILTSYFQDRSNIANTILPAEIESIDNQHNTLYQGQHINLAAILPVDVYNDSWYSIVAETTDFNSHNQYTEKVAKPIIAKRPFVIFAGQHYLKNLRQLGFKTFSPVIDESYDSIEDSTKRMSNAWKQVEWLCNQNPHDVYSELSSILDYNQHHFIETVWNKPVKDLFDTLCTS